MKNILSYIVSVLSLFLITVNVEAMRDLWFISDAFLVEMFPALQKLKTEAFIKKRYYPTSMNISISSHST